MGLLEQRAALRGERDLTAGEEREEEASAPERHEEASRGSLTIGVDRSGELLSVRVN